MITEIPPNPRQQPNPAPELTAMQRALNHANDRISELKTVVTLLEQRVSDIESEHSETRLTKAKIVALMRELRML